MLTDSRFKDALMEERKGPLTSKLLAGACAILVTALLLAGYAYLRKRHAVRNSASVVPVQSLSSIPKGPPKVHVLVDDPMLKAGETLIGGTVRNISAEGLDGLSVDLELRRRKDGTIEQRSIALEPAKLLPEQEGRYSLKLQAREYGGVRLIGVRGDDSALLAHTSSQGQRRPPEKTESKAIIVKPPSSRQGEFLNTPDNPGRVP